ncbi:MAG: monovalent cation/H+ antiporter complex subunit F, partial [Chloroflexota bacterium]
MFLAVSITILIVMVLALLRAVLGPTLFDRILAVNMFGTKIVLLVAVLGVIT